MKKILILGPALPKWSEIDAILETLQFLSEDYKFDVLDPLENIEEGINTQNFILKWRFKINALMKDYDAFFGFSLGGVILQQCFDFFEESKKPVILFAVPAFSGGSLDRRLNKVISLLERRLVSDAINEHNRYVFHPEKFISYENNENDDGNVSLRIVNGLKVVLSIDSRDILLKTKVDYLHFVGELSLLVNCNNIIVPSLGRTMVVPRAGMRVLKNNLEFCRKHILEFLSEKLK